MSGIPWKMLVKTSLFHCKLKKIIAFLDDLVHFTHLKNFPGLFFLTLMPSLTMIPSLRKMLIRKVPSWQSCPSATSSDSIWSMAASQAEARYAMVLGMSILKTWNYNYTRPDLRLIVITPTNIQRKSFLRLEEIGWGICYIKRIDYLLFGEKNYRVK